MSMFLEKSFLAKMYLFTQKIEIIHSYHCATVQRLKNSEPNQDPVGTQPRMHRLDHRPVALSKQITGFKEKLREVIGLL